MKNISFRLSDADHAAIESAAAHAFMPVSTFLRKLALEYARDRGLLESASTAPTPSSAEPAKAPAAIPLTDTGATNYRLVVAKARGRALSGMSRAQVAADLGVAPEFIEAACIEVAKEGEANPVLPWHSEAQSAKLRQYKADAQYANIAHTEAPDLTTYG